VNRLTARNSKHSRWFSCGGDDPFGSEVEAVLSFTRVVGITGPFCHRYHRLWPALRRPLLMGIGAFHLRRIGT
jgi:hypothetical protein